jgi:hypothetical protein
MLVGELNPRAKPSNGECSKIGDADIRDKAKIFAAIFRAMMAASKRPLPEE